MLERQSTAANFIDLLDRVVDKGIVIDGWVALSFVGINLVTIHAQLVVASVETYVLHADAIAPVPEPAGSRTL